MRIQALMSRADQLCKKRPVPFEVTDLHACNVGSLVDLSNISVLTCGTPCMLCRWKVALC
jgi:hypothetical protein